MRHTASQKVWQDAAGNLVPDGHENARVLVARQGQSLSHGEIAHFPNAVDFFSGLSSATVSSPADDTETSRETEYEEEDTDEGKTAKSPKRKK